MPSLLFQTDFFTVTQAVAYRVPGYVIIEAKQDVTRLSGFEPKAALELIQLITAIEAVVEQLTGAERVFVMKFAEVNPRVHFHIFPRTARIGKAFGAARGEAAPYNGAALVAWLWEHYAELGFTDSELNRFAAQARALLNP